jgi:hypothetical protein
VPYLPNSSGCCAYQSRDPATFRVTNRRIGTRAGLAAASTQQLVEAAAARDAGLRLVTDADALATCADVVAASDRIRYLCGPLHAELIREIRWSAEDVVRTRDGIDIETLELTPADRAGLLLTASWPVMRLVGEWGGGRSLEKPSRKAIAAASAVGLLTIRGKRPADFFAAGRATGCG